MSKVKIQGNASGTGVVTLTAPNTNTDRTITLPDDTQTLIGTNASGNVGIGTSSPSAALHISGSTTTTLPSIVLERTGSGSSKWDIKPYADTLTFRANATTDMLTIDGAGRVTMPNQPAFEVNITGSHANGQFTPTWGASWEVGSNVSTANKRFTAPVAGTYHFDAWIGYVGAWTSDRVIIYLNVNGSGRVSHQNYRSGQDTGTNLSTNFQLSAGDYVGISLYQDSGGTREIQSSVQWAGFGGYLIG